MVLKRNVKATRAWLRGFLEKKKRQRRGEKKANGAGTKENKMKTTKNNQKQSQGGKKGRNIELKHSGLVSGGGF